jgi:hypothetical protein
MWMEKAQQNHCFDMKYLIFLLALNGCLMASLMLVVFAKRLVISLRAKNQVMAREERPRQNLEARSAGFNQVFNKT